MIWFVVRVEIEFTYSDSILALSALSLFQLTVVAVSNRNESVESVDSLSLRCQVTCHLVVSVFTKATGGALFDSHSNPLSVASLHDQRPQKVPSKCVKESPSRRFPFSWLRVVDSSWKPARNRNMTKEAELQLISGSMQEIHWDSYSLHFWYKEYKEESLQDYH